jgi:hypothetical protein
MLWCGAAVGEVQSLVVPQASWEVVGFGTQKRQKAERVVGISDTFGRSHALCCAADSCEKETLLKVLGREKCQLQGRYIITGVPMLVRKKSSSFLVRHAL